MEIILRYFDGCPSWQEAKARLSEALIAERTSAPIRCELVANEAEAERLGFRGSPTILIDGVDPFVDPDSPIGFSCRLFQTEDGLQGSPSVAQLRAAMRDTSSSSP